MNNNIEKLAERLREIHMKNVGWEYVAAREILEGACASVKAEKEIGLIHTTFTGSSDKVVRFCAPSEPLSEPGMAGWRVLRDGELLQAGDQGCVNGEWKPVPAVLIGQEGIPTGLFRRPLTNVDEQRVDEEKEDADVAFALISVAHQVNTMYGEPSSKIIRSLRRRYGV